MSRRMNKGSKKGTADRNARKKPKKTTLSRLMARLCISLLVVGLIIILVGAALSIPVIQYIGAAIAVASIPVRSFCLKCPNCGYSGNLPQWKGNGTMTCKECKQALRYDK